MAFLKMTATSRAPRVKEANQQTRIVENPTKDIYRLATVAQFKFAQWLPQPEADNPR